MISDVRLQNFRSYEDASFEFESGVNIIVGPNASGKTNLLESILVACTGSSYRTKSTELINHGSQWSRIDLTTPSSLRTIKLELSPDNKIKKTHEIDKSKYIRLPMHKTLPVVLFEPNHLALMHGSPELRRDFLDNLLEQTRPGFGVLRRQYRRSLQQRNALLKQDKSRAASQLFVWNLRLSELGEQIAKARLELISQINQDLPDLYNEISGSNKKIVAEYISTVDQEAYGSKMLKKLEQDTDRDFLRGFTSHGPHRDDVVFKFDQQLVSETASRGEARTILLGLKIIELQIIEKFREQKPVLLMDDVFSELDGSRRKALTEHLKDHQTFITTTDADVVVQHFMDKCHIIPLG